MGRTAAGQGRPDLQGVSLLDLTGARPMLGRSAELTGLHMARLLYLIRHGATTMQGDGRYCGSTDVALSPDGAAQARHLQPLLATLAPGRCYVSPLQRARQTASAATAGLGVCMSSLDDLREVDFGDWEGLTFAEIQARDPEAVAGWAALAPEFRFPGGDSVQDFVDRIARALLVLAADPAERVIAVTHGGVIRAMICQALRLPVDAYLKFGIEPGTVTVLELFEEGAVLRGLGLWAMRGE